MAEELVPEGQDLHLPVISGATYISSTKWMIFSICSSTWRRSLPTTASAIDGLLPEVLVLDLGDRDVEAGLHPVGHPAEHLPLGLQRAAVRESGG